MSSSRSTSKSPARPADTLPRIVPSTTSGYTKKQANVLNTKTSTLKDLIDASREVRETRNNPILTSSPLHALADKVNGGKTPAGLPNRQSSQAALPHRLPDLQNARNIDYAYEIPEARTSPYQLQKHVVNRPVPEMDVAIPDITSTDVNQHFKDVLVDFVIAQKNAQVSSKEETERILLAITAEKEKMPSELRRRIDNADTRQEALDEFYKYFNEAIESTTAVTMDVQWVENILALIPEKMRVRSVDHVRAIVTDLQAEYEKAGRKAAIGHILRESHEVEAAEEEKVALAIPTMEELLGVQQVYSEQTWREAYNKYHASIDKHLYTCHPAIIQMLKVWARYTESRFSPTAEIKASQKLRLPSFRAMILVHCEKVNERMVSGWYGDLYNLFVDMFVATKKKFTTPQVAPAGLYRTAGVLIQRQAMQMINASAEEFMQLFTFHDAALAGQVPSIHAANEEDSTVMAEEQPHFLLKGAYTDEKILTEPKVADVKESLKEGLELVCKTLVSLPRLESVVYQKQPISETDLPPTAEEAAAWRPSFVASSANELKIGPDQAKYETAKTNVQKFCDDCDVVLQAYLAQYDKYLVQLNKEAAENIGKRFEEGLSFDTYVAEIKHFRDLATEIQSLKKTVKLPLFTLDCSDLHEALASRAILFADRMMTRITNMFREKQRQICNRYDTIQEDALRKPETFKDMTEMIAQMTRVKEVELPSLLEELSVSTRQMLYIFSSSTAPEDLIQLNATAFTWPHRIKKVLAESDQILMGAQSVNQELLRERRTRFNEELKDMERQISEFTNVGDYEEVAFHHKKLQTLQKQLVAAQETITTFNREEAAFGWQVTAYPVRKQLLSTLEPYDALYNVALNFQKSFKRYMDGGLMDLDAEQVEEEIEGIRREAYKLGSAFDNLAPKKIGQSTVEKADEFTRNMPLMRVLCNKGMRDRHWEKMSEVAGFQIRPDSATTMRKMLRLDLERWLTQFEDISASASKEFALEKSLAKMYSEWEPLSFNLSAYRDTGTSIVSSVEEIQQLLDDQIVKTQSMRSSPYSKPFEAQIKKWEKTLLTVQDILDEWLKVQATWLYLEPIFSSEDIMQQMPVEGAKFKSVDSHWRRIMEAACADPKVLSVAEIPNMVDDLKADNVTLEEVMKGLNDYLEVKRLYFPRFFFLSNDEMLEILSETKDPTRVQPHLKKCFEGVETLEFQPNLDISALFSAEKERLALKSNISTAAAKGSVEKWLLQVEQNMMVSVKDVIQQAFDAYPTKPRHEWVQDWPGQVVICVSQIYWTMAAEKAIQEGKAGLQRYAQQCREELGEIIKLVRGKLSKQARITLGALVVIDVHGRDVIAQLAEEGISELNDFSWLSQLRYYFVDGNVKVRIINAEKEYGYEYLGNSGRLVITPLTDRCYRTLIGALHLGLGGAPEGPAGTGKTETVKDLAKALAKQCVVFNCSDGLDFIAMGKFFKGLAASGAWACFDEFNRINVEVLSVVAQQILSIQRAVTTKQYRINFEGTDLTVNPGCAAFITMNPGYAGRSELPDNLKVLFRTVAMMVPSYTTIAEITLYSYGFVDARNLARKITATYRLCSEQLSSQDHYDYGMRAVKSVLVAAGNLKMRYPDEEESNLVLRSIIDVNLPKFLTQDIHLFKGITSDLFPGVVLPQPDYKLLEAAIDANCKRLGLQNLPAFQEKIIQLYEMMLVRHGFMIVGEPYAGKTSAYEVLCGALGDLAAEGVPDMQRVQTKVINPKSITMGQLYGEFDQISHEWTDGVLATSFRNFASSTSPDRKWLIFDGPVDAVWIENMNSVLDDNKKLCLNSGEIISLSNTMSLVFEVADLAVASPATVSRCGMIFMEPEALGWRPIVQSWVAKNVHTEDQACVNKLVDNFVADSLHFVRKECRELSPTGDSAMARSCMTIFETLIKDYKEDTFRARIITSPEAHTANLEAFFVYALIWSIGGTLDMPSQIKFNTFLRNALATHPIQLPLPAEGSVYDYVFNIKNDNAWTAWVDTLDTELKISKDATFNDIIIPTKDTARYSYLMDLLMTNGKPLLLVGPTGTGKSKYITDKILKGLDPAQYAPVFVNFSARTSANQTQDIIMSKLDKRRKGVYGPPLGKKCIVFVDDLNVPQMEQYGAQPPIELIRQLLDQGHWYDRSDTSKIELQDVQIVAAMGPPGGGRNFVTPRLLRHFNQVSINAFEDNTLERIFSGVLGWHFSAQSFSEELSAMNSHLVKATLQIYQWAVTNLLPTPAKTHYTFNLRDFARVIQGLTMSRSSTYTTSSQLRDLWSHEVCRVYMDRLVSNEDRSALQEAMQQALKDHFGGAEGMDPRGLMFGNFAPIDIPNASSEEQPEVAAAESAGAVTKISGYADLTPYLPHVTSYLMNQLSDYNVTHKNKMNLVLFRFAVEHTSRICRILSLPGGNALLVGVGGSGRSSLSRLAAHLLGYESFSIEISKSYGKVEWRDDLRKLLRMAGLDNKKVAFLFNDTQIKDESFVEDISNLLNTCDVPNLFAADEKQEIQDRCARELQQEGKSADLTPAMLYNYFISKVRNNLHVVLCMSPIGEAFRTRLRQFSSLVNCCTIDWFQAWPDEALQAVAARFFDDFELEKEMRPRIVDLCKQFHQDIVQLSDQYKQKLSRYNYVTPTSYLELLQSYKQLLTAKRQEISTIKNRYAIGLEKLNFAAQSVERMKVEIAELQPQLRKTSEETALMLVKIEKESVEVEATRQVISGDEAVATKKAEESTAMKRECEADLAEALPLLEAALTALDTLKKSDIDTVKAMKNPPEGVKLVMEAVCVMKDLKAERVPDPSGSGRMLMDYWKTSLKMLGDPQFLTSLKTFDKDNIDAAIIKKIRTTYIPNPEFRPEKVRNASSAAEGLCSWVIALEAYDRVIKVVAPKQAALAQAESELAVTMKSLEEKRAQLKEVQDRLDKLQANLQELADTKVRLSNQLATCEIQLVRAEKLLGGLGGEKSRWTQNVEELGRVYHNLTGDVLVSAGFISYLGAFTKGYRLDMAQQWIEQVKAKGIPCSDKFSLAKVLGDPIKIRAWNIAGLPTDAFSIDNGIMLENARRWPLMIDPQGQANKWIKNMEAENKLQVIKLTDADYLRKLENALQFGMPVLLENVTEELDPILDPILLKQTFRSGGSLCIKLGDATVEYSPNFRFYITTKMRNPHYLPEVATKVTLTNFMITPEGLEDQLLGTAVLKEKPELEEEKAQLILQSAENKKKLKDIEDQILSILSNAEGNILENEQAIEVLSSSKVIADDISEKQTIAEETERKIDETRNSYRPIANHSAIMFFAIADLANIDAMYQYSLTWYVDLFLNAIAMSKKSNDLSKRLKNLETFFTYSLYCNVCRSLFEREKLLFSFLLCCKILINRKELTEGQVQFLLTGGISLDQPPKNPDPTWIADKTWAELNRLSALPTHAGLTDNFEPAAWRPLYDALEPHTVALPAPWETQLNEFGKLMILRCFRPERMIPAIQEFVKVKLGHKFIEPPAFDLKACYDDSSSKTPLIFILSPGVDVMGQLFKFADAQGLGAAKCQTISLGQGQGPLASQLIKTAQREGTWVCLQNCHLSVSWMPALERIVDEMSNNPAIHKQFRLWLTSYPSPSFPAAILQSGIKITNEAPKGVRANVTRTYISDPVSDVAFYNGCAAPGTPEGTADAKSVVFQKLLFSLSFFHAIVQERKGFGPLGFNIPYGFDETDFKISARQLQMLLNQYKDIPYKAISYLTGECNYGGRVTDDWDRRTLISLLNNYYHPNVVSEPDYKLSASGTYVIPSSATSHNDFVEYIRQLPITQQPEVFGIHDNGDIARQLSETKTLFDSALQTQEKVESAGQKSNDQVLAEVSQSILAQIPAPFAIDTVLQSFPVSYAESMNIVLVQEMVRFNRLTNIITTSLRNLQKALKGLVIMSAELDELARSILLGKIPALWAGKSYPSLKPLGAYVADLVERLNFFDTWYKSGKTPSVFWMSGFFFVQSFVTSALQNYARKYKIPIDELTLDFEVMPDDLDTSKPPAEGVYVRGLYLTGARWDKAAKEVQDSQPKVLSEPLPILWFKPIKQVEVKTAGTYTCPVYKTSARRGTLSTTGHSTNFVLPIRLPSSKPESFWTLRGVAALLQLDD